jgi:transcription elongation factor Elf1
MKIKVYIEKLYHFQCPQCNHWWSIADGKIAIGQETFCPACGIKHEVEKFEIGEDKI